MPEQTPAADLRAYVEDLEAQLDDAHARVAELEAQRDRVREVHQPIEALNMRHHPRGQLTRVCSGCGTDDGNWQTWPCPTIRALDRPGDGPAHSNPSVVGR